MLKKITMAAILGIAVLTSTAGMTMAQPWPFCHWHRWCHGPFHRGPFFHRHLRLHRDYILRDHDYAE